MTAEMRYSEYGRVCSHRPAELLEERVVHHLAPWISC
jgi:hypothetical protein